MKEQIIKNDLLFHSAHGLCRVIAVTRTPQSKELSYSLLPHPSTKTKIRFTVPESSLENSGFSKVITAKEAHAILEYFKTGERKNSGDHQTWDAAVMILAESSSKESMKDARKRHLLERSVKGLVGQIAFVFNISLKETIEKIRKSLGALSNVSPSVLAALAHADDA